MASWSSSKPLRSSSSSWPRAASEMLAAEGGGGGGGAGVSGLCSHAEALAGATAMCDRLLRRCVRTGAVGGAENCTRVGRSAVGSGSTGASAATARMRWNCSWRPWSRVSRRSRPRAHLSAGYSAEAISSRVKVGCAALLSAEAGAASTGRRSGRRRLLPRLARASRSRRGSLLLFIWVAAAGEDRGAPRCPSPWSRAKRRLTRWRAWWWRRC